MSSRTDAATAPLRILMYSAYFGPEYSGAALQALTLAGELRKRGCQVEFLTNRWPGLSAEDEASGFPIHRVEAGRAHKHREFRLWYNLARYIWRRRKEFDVLHSHGAYYSCSIVGPLARATGMKSLVKASLANDDLQDLNRTVIGSIHRWMLDRVDAYIAISQDLAAEFRGGGLSTEKIHYLPNGVDTGRFRPCDGDRRAALRRALGLPADRPIVLYVGVMDRRKNIQWLTEKWIENGAFGTDALLLAVGPRSRDDPDRLLIDRLEALSTGHPDRLQVRGFVNDIADYYRAVDVLILPSSREGLPNVVLEAMATALPCVAAEASGSSELIQKGVTGFTYRRDDVETMSEGLRRCLSPDGRALGERGKKVVEDRFSISTVADGYMALYRKLARKARG